jgi:hypothetical protein
MNNKYRFNESEHLHELCVNGEWKPLTGCTTILKVLAKPALIQWSANMAVQYIDDEFCKISVDYETPAKFLKALETEWPRILLEAKSAHRKRKEKAGDWGTKLHEEVERFINNRILTDGRAKDITKYEDKIKDFITWTNANKVKFLATEKNVYSEKYFLGGIVDFICEIDGKVWIGDIKTSKSGIYPENFAQCAGYQLMLQEMGLYPDIAGYIIVNIKENGEFQEKRSISNGNNTKFFLACLEIYRQQERLKQQTL